MSYTTAVRSMVASALGSAVTDLRRVAGGDFNDAHDARLTDSRVVLVKTSTNTVLGSYTAEAAGLRWSARCRGRSNSPGGSCRDRPARPCARAAAACALLG